MGKNNGDKLIDRLRNESKDLEIMNRALSREISSARRIIWAMAHSQGGRIEVPNESMNMASDSDAEISAAYDKINECTVIQARLQTSGKPN